MSIATKTTNPLHLEDLEPHRFEDLIRQLLYDFRSWRQLEATGRSGSDKSFDARGWEIVPDLENVSDTNQEPDESEEVKTIEDRLWLIQCKREKSITPAKMEKYLNDIPEDQRKDIYGIVFVAACDFSLKTREVFRHKAREFGFKETQLWGKGEIEDLLFQPKNDHILFAYTGISLQIRQRSLKTQLRSKLAMKRKVQKQLEDSEYILLRDAQDEKYPYLNEDTKLERLERGKWLVKRYVCCDYDGVHLLHKRQFAYISDDGKQWDVADTMNDAVPGTYEDPWANSEKIDKLREERQAVMDIWDKLPDQNKAWLEMYLILPYENILDIDKMGDSYFNKPQLYTTAFDLDMTLFRDYQRYKLETRGYDKRSTIMEDNGRITIFPRKNDDKK